MAKPIWQSKTFWANAIGFAATIGGVFNFDLPPEQQTAIVGGIMALINIFMRLVSKDQVKLLGGGDDTQPPKKD